jgi:hypothetical protein
MKSVALAALVVFSLIALGGQVQTGTITGTVRDSSGATIPGATVKATNGETGKVTTMVTDQNGGYAFSSLPVGTYAVDAALPGFENRRFSGLTVAPSSAVRQDFALGLQRTPSPFDRYASADIAADSQSRQGAVTAYRGHVRMTTDTTIILADELDFNMQTQRADVRGNVSVQLRQVGPRVIPVGKSQD